MSAHRSDGLWMRVIRRGRGRGSVLAMSSVILILLIVMFMGNTLSANGRNFRAKYAGAVSTTEIDINLDEEETARVSTGVGRGTVIGPFVFHEIRESDLLEPGHPENTCDPGEEEQIDIHWTLLLTDQRGNNQLAFRLAEDQPSMICQDPDNPPMGGGSRIHDFDIIGGTGRFDGASGRVTVECGGFPLAPGVRGAGPAHGAVTCTMHGFLDY